MVKFAPLALVPLYAAGFRGLLGGDGEGRRLAPLRPVVMFSLGFVVAAALLLVYPAIDSGLGTFFDRTVVSQLDRTSPFSIWGQVDGIQWLQTAILAATAVLAALLAFVPRRRDLAAGRRADRRGADRAAALGRPLVLPLHPVVLRRADDCVARRRGCARRPLLRGLAAGCPARGPRRLETSPGRSRPRPATGSDRETAASRRRGEKPGSRSTARRERSPLASPSGGSSDSSAAWIAAVAGSPRSLSVGRHLTARASPSGPISTATAFTQTSSSAVVKRTGICVPEALERLLPADPEHARPRAGHADVADERGPAAEARGRRRWARGCGSRARPPARPSRCQPIATFSEVTSAWKSITKASARSASRSSSASTSANGERAARSWTSPIRLITQTRDPPASTITCPWPGLAGHEVRRPDDALGAIEVVVGIAVAVGVVAERDHVGADREQVLAGLLGDPEAAGGVLAVDDHQVGRDGARADRASPARGRRAPACRPRRRRTAPSSRAYATGSRVAFPR